MESLREIFFKQTKYIYSMFILYSVSKTWSFGPGQR